MRQHLEPLIEAEEQARLDRLAVDRAADPVGYVRADATWRAAHQQLEAAAREALRERGFVREAAYALRGTGYTLGRIPLSDGLLLPELAGGPDTPVEYLHVPSAALALRTLLDDFHAATGIEVRMPDALTV